MGSAAQQAYAAHTKGCTVRPMQDNLPPARGGVTLLDLVIRHVQHDPGHDVKRGMKTLAATRSALATGVANASCGDAYKC